MSWSNLQGDVEFSHRGAHRGRHGSAKRTSCAKRADNERTTCARAVRFGSVRCSAGGYFLGGCGSVRFGALFGWRLLPRWLRFGGCWLSRLARFCGCWLSRLARFCGCWLSRLARFGLRLLPRCVPSLPMWTPNRAHSLTAPMGGGVPGGLVRARRGGRHPGDDGTPDTSLGGLALPTEGAPRRGAVGAKPPRVGAGGTAAHGGRHTRTRTVPANQAPPTHRGSKSVCAVGADTAAGRAHTEVATASRTEPTERANTHRTEPTERANTHRTEPTERANTHRTATTEEVTASRTAHRTEPNRNHRGSNRQPNSAPNRTEPHAHTLSARCPLASRTMCASRCRGDLDGRRGG